MNILFSGVPAFGHLLPMLPLARAARRAGHEAAVLTDGAMAVAVGDVPVLPAGPPLDVLIAETVHRTGVDPSDASDPSDIAELFAGVRVDLTLDGALAAAREFGPDLIVCEPADFVGPMVAAFLGVPWAKHNVSIARPEALDRVMGETVAPRYAERGLSPTARMALVDPWPETVQPDAWARPDDTITLRPQPHSLNSADSWSPPVFPDREGRPLVLVTLGTVVGSFAPQMPEKILASVASEDVNIVVTLGPGGAPEAFDGDRSRVFPVGFVPLEQLLKGVDLVVSAGGAGTVLGTLGRGLPMVLVPVLADQPKIAGCVGALGAAAVVDAPERTGEAVSKVLTDPSYRKAAAAVARRMGEMNPPQEALRLLLGRVP